jgi:ABC-2 type transport system ATP-binding protein
MITVKNLTKYYSDKCAIQNLEFEINKGEIVGLLGLNGSGKTTTIRILSGYLIPTEGEVWIEGINLFSNPLEIKKKIGYLPESPPLYEELSVYSYLEFVARLKSVQDIPNEIEISCKKTNLTHVKENLISTLSLGYRKRVGIAQALLGNPEIVIMDEPISGLDPKQIVEIRNLIKQLSKSHTIFLSSHILSEVYQTCDRFLFLQDGKILYNYTKKSFEEEVDKLSDLEIGLSGKSKDELEQFLKSIDSDSVIDLKSEETSYFLFRVKTKNQNQFKSNLLLGLNKEQISLELLKKDELTLEEFFVKRV